MADTTPNTPPEDDKPLDAEGHPKPQAPGEASALISEDGVEFDFNGGEGEEAGAPQPPQSPLEFLQQQLVEVEAERDEYKDKLLRTLAEGENIRRRAMRDREEGETYGGVKLARDLLAVYDNLDRALQAADESVRTSAPDFIAGVELTQRELLNAFAKHKIAPVAPQIGDKFDANRHQAMFESPAPGAENGTVIQVMQQGFEISDRLLRAAMVGVAKNPPGAQPAAPQAADDDAPTDTDGDETPPDPTQPT